MHSTVPTGWSLVEAPSATKIPSWPKGPPQGDPPWPDISPSWDPVPEFIDFNAAQGYQNLFIPSASLVTEALASTPTIRTDSREDPASLLLPLVTQTNLVILPSRALEFRNLVDTFSTPPPLKAAWGGSPPPLPFPASLPSTSRRLWLFRTIGPATAPPPCLSSAPETLTAAFADTHLHSPLLTTHRTGARA